MICPQRIVVLGGSGFIGSAIANRLARLASEPEIIVVGRANSSAFFLNKRIRYVKCDVNNLTDLASVINGATDVIDLVAELSTTNMMLPSSSFINSVASTTMSRIYEIYKSDISRYYYFSSGGAVYGNVEADIMREILPLRPISQYGLEKVLSEHFIGYLERSAGFKAIILRPSNPYGGLSKDCKPRGFIGQAIYSALLEEEVYVYGNPGTVRDYIHIDDLANAFVAVFCSETTTGVYNIGTGTGFTNLDIISIINTSLKTRSLNKVKVVHLPYRTTDVRKNVLAIDRLKDQLNWLPRVTIEEGVERLTTQLLKSYKQ